MVEIQKLYFITNQFHYFIISYVYVLLKIIFKIDKKLSHILKQYLLEIF